MAAVFFDSGTPPTVTLLCEPLPPYFSSAGDE
jgi:hypothetical protein